MSVKKKTVKPAIRGNFGTRRGVHAHMTSVGLKLPEVQKEGMCRDAAEKRPSRKYLQVKMVFT